MFDVENCKNILVIKLGALGDVMMSEGVMRCIRQAYPNAKITLMTEPLYARFMTDAPHFDEIIPHKRVGRLAFGEFRKLKKQLQSAGYDLVIDLQNSNYSKKIFSWLPGSKISSTAKNVDYRYVQDKSRQLPLREYLRQQVEMLGVDMSAGHFPNLEWAAADVSHILENTRIEDGFVLLNAGSAARHPGKRWHLFPQLIAALAERNITAVTAPGPDEADLCANLPAPMLMDGDKFLTLNQVVGLARHCGMVIGNDTGPTHMMAAAGTKGVALFGSDYSPAWQTGVADIYEVVEKPLLSDITVDEVLAAMDRAQSNSV